METDSFRIGVGDQVSFDKMIDRSDELAKGN